MRVTGFDPDRIQAGLEAKAGLYKAHPDYRIGLNAARNSTAKICGCSQAAK